MSSGNAVALARRFVTNLGQDTIEDAIACFAEDGVQDMPLSPPDFPNRLEGIDTLRRLWRSVARTARSMTFTLLDVVPFADPRRALVEFTGEIVLPSGKTYRNHYFGIVHAENGHIKRYVELYDTYAFVRMVDDADRAAMFGAGQE
jgi:uncharacterized protein